MNFFCHQYFLKKYPAVPFPHPAVAIERIPPAFASRPFLPSGRASGWF